MTKMLKKSISIIMAILMLSTCFAVFASAEETAAPAEARQFTDAQIARYKSDIAFLKAAGIWVSPNTDYPNNVTRGEFASALSRLCNLDEASIGANLKYDDVTNDTLFSKYIYSVGMANLMVGSDGKFRPEEYITFNQAAKAVVTALGYQGIANAKGGYPEGYYAVALDLGLTTGAGREEFLTRYDVVTLIKKACEIDVMDLVGVSDEDAYYEISEDRNVLSVYHNILKIEARFQDDGLTNLKGKTQCAGNNVMIGGLILKNESVVTDGFLGYNVIAYYDADEEKVLYVEKNDRKNEVLTVKAEDLETESTKFKKTNVVYNNGNRAVDVKVSPYADFIYNGSSYPAFLVNDLKIKAGTLTFVDVDFDKTYDVVIAEEYKNYILQSNNEALQLISDRNGNEFRYGEYEKFEFFDGATFETKPISRLKANSVVSVYASKDNVRIKFVVSENKIDGQVVAIETNEDGEETLTVKHLVEGEEVESQYEYSATFLENIENGVAGFKKAIMNDNLSIRLDFEGRIAGFEGYKDQYQYAYFIKAGKDSNSKLASKCLIKMVIPTGDLVTVSTAKKIIVNGASTEDGLEILNITDLYKDGNVGGEFLPQIVKVKLSALGELKEIETTNETENCKSGLGFDLSKFCKVFETDKSRGYSEYYNNKRLSYDGKYIMDANTAIYVVRSGEAFTEEDIRVVKPEELYDCASRAWVKMYDANEYWVTKAVLVEPLENSNYLRGSGFTISKVKKGVDADGEDIYFLTGLYKNIDYTYREAKPGIIDAALEKQGITDGPKFGDIYYLQVDENFNIIGIKLMARTSNFTPFVKTQQGIFDTGESVLYGHILGKNDTSICITTDYGNSMSVTPFGSALPPVVIDYRNKEVRVGTFAEIPVGASMDAAGNFTMLDNGVMFYMYRYSGYTYQSAVVIR